MQIKKKHSKITISSKERVSFIRIFLSAYAFCISQFIFEKKKNNNIQAVTRDRCFGSFAHMNFV